MFKEICPKCKGARLKDEALSITIMGSNIAEVTAQSIIQTLDWVNSLKLSDRENQIATPILKEIKARKYSSEKELTGEYLQKEILIGNQKLLIKIKK